MIKKICQTRKLFSDVRFKKLCSIKTVRTFEKRFTPHKSVSASWKKATKPVIKIASVFERFVHSHKTKISTRSDCALKIVRCRNSTT